LWVPFVLHGMILNARRRFPKEADAAHAVFLHDPSREKRGSGKSADFPEPQKFK
jgi:hypothetical protein